MRGKRSIERKASDTLLEKRMEVMVGGHRYSVAPPSLATLMEVSGLIGGAKDWDNVEDEDTVAGVALMRAKDAPMICEVVSTLILGANRAVGETSWLEGMWLKIKSLKRNSEKIGASYEADKKLLVERLMHEVTPNELLGLMTTLLEGMELGAFFGITTFLRELNVAKPTREVV